MVRLNHYFHSLSKSDIILAALFALALIIRCFYLLELSTHLPFFYEQVPGDDSYTYYYWAKDILQGNLLTSDWGYPTHSLLYALILAFIFYCFGPLPEAVAIVQFILGSSAIFILASLLKNRVKPTTLWIVLVMYILSAPIIFYESFMMRDFLVGYLTLWLAWLWLRIVEHQSAAKVIALGMLCAFSYYCRENTFYYLPLFIACIIFLLNASKRQKTHYILYSCLGYLIGAAPFIVINLLSHAPEQPIMASGIKLLIWANMHTANNIGAIVPYGSEAIFDQLQGSMLKFLGWFLQEWVQHPLAMLTLYAKKIIAYIAYAEIPNNENFHITRDYIPILSYLPVGFNWFAILTSVSVCWVYKNNRPLRGIVWLVLLISLSLLPFLGLGRYRLQAFYLLIILAAAAIEYLHTLYAEKKWRQFIFIQVSVIMLIILSYFTNNPIYRSQDYYNLSVRSLRSGHLSHSYTFIKQAYAIDPLPIYLEQLQLIEQGREDSADRIP